MTSNSRPPLMLRSPKHDRASMNKLSTDSIDCPSCRHRKALVSQRLIKCAKCKCVMRRF